MCSNDNNDSQTARDTRPYGSAERQAIEMLVTGLAAILDIHRQQVISDTKGMVIDLNKLMAQIASAHTQTTSAIDGVTRQVARVMNQAKLTEAALRENTVLSEQYYEAHILEPIVRVIFSVVDLLDDSRASWFESAATIDASVLALVDGIYTQLSLFFSIHGIEMLRHGPTDRFDPFVMRPAKIVEAATKEMDSCVAKSLQTGFRFATSGRLLRPESVVLYKYRTERP